MNSGRSPGRDVPRDHGTAHRRALVLGIGASAGLHLILILLYSVVITQWGLRETVLAVDSPLRGWSDMRVVQLIELAPLDFTAEAPVDPATLTAEAELELTDEGPPIPDEVELNPPPGRRRASEVLRIRSSDARLWREAMPELFELTDAERMQLSLAGRLEEWTDSVAGVVAAELALTDWTTIDDQGRRWGISPGKLHLGDLTLPLPFYFSGNGWQRDQASRRAWVDQDILSGANVQALRSSWRERAEAIRRRRDRDRVPDPPAPDTTGASGG
jgi:hypothetical protein